MNSPSVGVYPDNWPEIAFEAKEEAGWKCVRCGHANEPASGYTLTVHHLDGNKSNCEKWNLAALCQRCHLHIQGVVNMFQAYMFEHTDWMEPFVRGMEVWRRAHFPHLYGSGDAE